MKVRFLRARYFVWMLAWIALVAATQLFGLPHVLWSYELPGHCRYFGVSGGVNIYSPHADRCPWILFRKSTVRASQ